VKNWVQVAEGLWRLAGRIGGYALVQRDRCLLIDPPRIDWHQALAELPASRVDWILATHHHRDTLGGAADLLEAGARLHVPAAEADLVADVERFWQTARTYILYDCSSKFFSLRRSVPVAGKFEPGQSFELGPWTVTALPLRGHTEGHCGYLIEQGSRRVAFVGDAFGGYGTVHNWHDFHWGYMDFNRGHRALLEDLEGLADRQPDLLCPAHAEPIEDPTGPIAALRTNLRRFIAAVEPNRLPRPHDEMRRILPHVWFVGQTCYAIVADDGACLLWDVGYPNEMRQRLGRLQEQANITRIEAIAFSHYHDDHTWRATEAAFGATGTTHENPPAEIWAHEILADILRRPHAYRLPCLMPDPMRLDRVFDDEPFDFHGIPMRYIFMPGQTYWHAALIAQVDGKTVAFTGDNIWHRQEPSRPINGPVISRNRYLPGKGFDYSARRLLELGVDWICPAHGEPFGVSRTDLEDFVAWADEAGASIRALAGDDRLGVDAWWGRFDPFHIYARPGETLAIRVVVDSPFDRPVRIQVRLLLPDGFAASCMQDELYLAPGQSDSVQFTLKAPDGWPADRRLPITADLTVDGELWPEQAEALIIPRTA